jgi:hypothetical protein
VTLYIVWYIIIGLTAIFKLEMDKYKKIKIVGKGSFGFAVLVESRRSKKQFIIKV